MLVDLIVTNAKVITMNPRRPVEEAFAVSDGKIVATGSAAEIERLCSPRTERMDLGGKTVTPGLIDTHIHVVSLGSVGAGAGLAFVNSGNVLDIAGAKTKEDILDAVADRARQTAKGDWVITGWPKALKSGEGLTCWDLDKVSPDTPVMVTGYPYSIVNSMLLRAGGITRDTPVPPGGEIIKDPATGEPTGVLAFQAIYQLLPPPPQPSVEETESAIRQVQAEFLSEGLTTYKDVGLRDNAIKAYQNLRMRNELRCRTQMMVTWMWSIEDALETARRFTPYGDDRLMLRSAKLSLDGGIKSRTAWSHETWNRNFTQGSNEKGYWKIPPDQFGPMVEILHSAGLQVCCHAEGDRAIDEYLDAIEAALERHPRTNCRHTIIHCNLPTDRAIERMRRLGDNIAAEMQAPWLGDANWAGSCGPGRAKRFNPFKTLLRSGIVVGNSCDYPPEPFPPRLGLSRACTREPEQDTFGKQPYGTEECLTFEESLHTYTLGAAKCLFWEDKIGSIEAGKYADFVVWEQDVSSLPPSELKDAKVLMTGVEGEVVFRRDGTKV